MRILKIFDGDLPWDVRVEKIAGSLRRGGHEVRILCRNRQGRVRHESGSDGIEIVRLPALSGALTAPAFFNPIWWHAISRQIRDFRPDRLLVRDLPLAPLAVAHGRRASIPVIADLAEPYPDSLRARHRFERLSLLGRLARNPKLADAVERWVVRRIDQVLVVCPEAGHRLEARGLPERRWTEVGNTPVLELFSPEVVAERLLDGLEDRCVLFFSGLLAGDRGRYHPWALLAWYLGLRVGDIHALKWEDVSFERSEIRAWVQKTRERITIPINGAVTEILQSLGPKDSGQILEGRREGLPYREWKKACKAAGVDVRINRHSIRRGFATDTAAKGATITTVQELGGWRTPVMALRYIRTADAAKRAAVERRGRIEIPQKMKSNLESILSK